MRFNELMTILGLAASIVGVAWAGESAPEGNAKPGPHGGQVVGDDATRFEVKINPDANRVEVFTLDPKKRAPAQAPRSITLYKDRDTAQTVELRAAASPAEQFPRYEGELGPNAGSYAGFELSFGVNAKALKVLPYIPYIPPRQH